MTTDVETYPQTSVRKRADPTALPNKFAVGTAGDAGVAILAPPTTTMTASEAKTLAAYLLVCAEVTETEEFDHFRNNYWKPIRNT